MKKVTIDWKKVEKLYKSLGVPREFYAPPFAAIPFNRYFMGLSDRSTGKTTNWILVGMCANRLYGTVIQYVRSTEDELAPSHATALMDTIRQYDDGKYVRELTGGVYNGIYYHWKAFYYAAYDDKGERVAVAPEPFMQCLSIDKNGDYKSSYNAPRGDIIMWDEFISKKRFTRLNECVDFLDLCKTIIRDRTDAIIVMLANTISLSSPIYEDLEIQKEIRQLKRGDRRQIVTEKGTHIFAEIIDAEISRSEKRQEVNRLYFGFKNPKLSAITGEGLYAFDSVPHIPPRDGSFILYDGRIYIQTGTELLRVEICRQNGIGTHLQIHRATRTYDDSVILSLDAPTKSRHFWGFGSPKMTKLFGKFLSSNKVFFASNEIGTIFNEYLKRYKALKLK